MTATDPNGDNLQYKVVIYSNGGCSTVVQTDDETVSQTGWSGMNASSSSAFSSGTQGTYTTQSALTASTTYYWNAFAKDPWNSNTWTQSAACNSFTVPPAGLLPGTPGTPSPTNIQTSTLTLSWTAASNATYYTIQRSPNTTSSYSTVATTSALTYNDSGLTSSSTYWYQIFATNSSGSGPTSTGVSVTMGHTTTTVTYLTASTTWTVPANWNNSSNTIETIGGGGGGGGGGTSNTTNSGAGGGGGGGGAYSIATNVTLTPSAQVTVSVGAGGAAAATGADSFFCNATTNCANIASSSVVVGAKGGGPGTAGSTSAKGAAGSGGASASGFGNYKVNGGAGAAGGATSTTVGGGGGGAGGAGGCGSASCNSGSQGAAGSAGNAGSGQTGGVGGEGDNTYGGAGGAAAGGAGGAGAEWGTGHGSGGGGGGGTGGASNTAASVTGGTAGAYGAGGGGGGGGGKASSGTKAGSAGKAGSVGIVVITYSYVVPGTVNSSITITHIDGAYNEGNTTPITCSLPAAPNTGDTVLVGTMWYTGSAETTTESIEDGNSNVYTIATTTPDADESAGTPSVAYLLSAPANASAAITASFGVNGDVAIWCDDFTVSGGTASFDDAGNGSGTGNPNAPTLSATGPVDLFYALATTQGSMTAISTPWQYGGGLTQDGSWGEQGAYATSTSATTVNFTNSGSDWWVAAAEAIKL
jgi:hypothetical protein